MEEKVNLLTKQNLKDLQAELEDLKVNKRKEIAAKIKEALCTLFENDASSARPEGSMEVCRVYWWEHDSKTPKYSSAKIHRLLHIKLKVFN